MMKIRLPLNMKVKKATIGLSSCLRWALLFSTMVFCYLPLFGQVDSTFWFAVPQVGTHGNQNSELVISNINKSAAAVVKISSPANNTAGTIGGTLGFEQFTIPVGGSIRVDLNKYYGKKMNPGLTDGSLYDLAANKISANGLLIESSTAVSVFYELGRDVQGYVQGNNTEIFSLKGGNALGTEFMLPFQNQYHTWSKEQSYSSANIIATSDNTVITITPSSNAEGHPAGIPFSITLDRGQTYSLRAADLAANLHLSGTVVTSTKPIAITLVDDSLETDQANFGNGNGGIDMVGDQLVPLSVLGKEYIVARGSAGTSAGAGDRNRIFILPTQPNTNITILENNTVAQTYTAQSVGKIVNYLQPPNSPASYIKSDKPIYVFYVSGSKNELGGALLPPVICTGSQDVNIVRSSAEEFYLIILTRNKNKGFFQATKNGQPIAGLINPSDFTEISSGPEGFSVLNKKFEKDNLAQIPILTAISISNTKGYFHAGMSVTGISSGSFGYFSDFASINISFANKPVCYGETLELDAGPNRDRYEWFTRDASGTKNIKATTQKYKVEAAGQQKIYLFVTKKSCELNDSVDVYIQPKVNLTILRKKIACNNQPVSMDATPEVTVPPLNVVKYRWYSKTPTIPASSNADTFGITSNVTVKFPVSTGVPLIPHKIFVNVTDDKGCVSTDSVDVTIRPTPPVSLGSFADAKVCSGDSVQLGMQIVNPSTNKLIFDWTEDAAVPPLQQPAT
ncbi:MAG TPA: IgGFc-binding protein, partial [Cytophagaceae bacterium]